MNFNQLINMFFRQLANRLMRRGIDSGINMMAGGKSKQQRTPGQAQRRMTPEEAKQARDIRAATKRARQAARITRRIGR
ncbi:hypothetical protein [Paracoccus pacificus]|uniref:Uncharacterized protein n=1 Tax=Paracoccus pacificus TaxID=1463598 RepID=A0ABW4R2Z8_9RHOB